MEDIHNTRRFIIHNTRRFIKIVLFGLPFVFLSYYLSTPQEENIPGPLEVIEITRKDVFSQYRFDRSEYCVSLDPSLELGDIVFNLRYRLFSPLDRLLGNDTTCVYGLAYERERE